MISKKPSKEKKAKLEKKLVLARENPEPVFDLSDCELKEVPSNIYLLCKVFRKEMLYLQQNNLSSLSHGGALENLKELKALNISSNKFTNLPTNICSLQALEILNISKNQIEELPSEIGALQNLKYINVSSNRLHSLPRSLGNCRKIESLDIANNKNLTELPVTLGNLIYLVNLVADDTITYPPPAVFKGGTSAVLAFLRKESKNEEILASTSAVPNVNTQDCTYDRIQDHLKQLELTKKQRQVARMNVEQQLKDEKEKELVVIQEHNNNKTKLLEKVREDQINLDAELSKIQSKKDKDRAKLISRCLEEEKTSNDVICKILNNNKKLKMEALELQKKEKKEEEEMLLRSCSDTDLTAKKQIILSMDETIKKEIEKCSAMNSKKRLGTYQSLATEVSQKNDAVMEFFKKFEKNQAQLVETLARNEELQKSAVASLLERNDAISWELTKQISIIETKLVELTRLELSRKKLETESLITELSSNRLALTSLLMSLLDEKRTRREHLISIIQKMQSMKDKNKEINNFWVRQYEKLLNSKAHDIVSFMEATDPKLVYHLFVNGVICYLPLLQDIALSTKNLESLNSKQLYELGIKSLENRNSILRAVEAFLESEETKPSVAPSAPPLTSKSTYRSVTDYLVSEECVICLENKPNVIFIPCGHICCCYRCFTSIALCPLCRKPIDVVQEGDFYK